MNWNSIIISKFNVRVKYKLLNGWIYWLYLTCIWTCEMFIQIFFGNFYSINVPNGLFVNDTQFYWPNTVKLSSNFTRLSQRLSFVYSTAHNASFYRHRKYPLCTSTGTTCAVWGFLSFKMVTVTLKIVSNVRCCCWVSSKFWIFLGERVL